MEYRNLEKNHREIEKFRGYTYKITHIKAANCPRVAHFVSFKKKTFFML